MAIIGKVERKNWKVRLLNLVIHLILMLGAATMIYPLLLMLSGSIKSNVDFSNYTISPEYLYNTKLLYQKYIHTKYNSVSSIMYCAFKIPPTSVNNLEEPSPLSRERYEDYRSFLRSSWKSCPHYWRMIGMAYEDGVDALSVREFKKWLYLKYGTGEEGLKALNEANKTSYDSWDAVYLPTENFYSSGYVTDYVTGILPEVLAFKNTQLSGLNTIWTDLDGHFSYSCRNLWHGNLRTASENLGFRLNCWSDLSLPESAPVQNPKFLERWRRFVKGVNPAFLSLDEGAKDAWTVYLRKSYKNDLQQLNAEYKTQYTDFKDVEMPLRVPEHGARRTTWINFVTTNAVPITSLHVETLGNRYRAWLREKYGTLEKVNEAYHLGYRDFSEVPLEAECPSGNLSMEEDWLAFSKTLNPEHFGILRSAAQSFRLFVEHRYEKKDKIDYKALSLDYNRPISNRMEIPFSMLFPEDPGAGSKEQEIFLDFVKEPANIRLRIIANPDARKAAWVAFLKERYSNDIRNLNRKWGRSCSSWETISLPAQEYEWYQVTDNRWLLIKEYLTRNYVMVIDTLVMNGYAARNTLLYCCLAVLASLLVNPLCAYGLSRFKMAPAYKILLFLMLPMAFPAMVLGIPQFLLVKKLGLLNTFAALILPSMANGYMIFLLKGFFDSLPKELFESAALDGASEWTVFWHIAMGLSTPILSVLALNTFTAAYGNFMMAFLLCQEKSMWTMMVYLYQLQQRASQSVGFAALIIAAIPTLLVFIFCQNIIIKGIVVPTEK